MVNLKFDDPLGEIEYDDDEYMPSEPGMLDHEDIVERATDDEPDDQPIQDGHDEDDPKPDDDSKTIPAAPPKVREPAVVKRNDHVPVGAPTPEPMSMGIAGDGIIYLDDIGETVKLDKKDQEGTPIQSRKGWEFRPSPRQRSKHTPEEWSALSIPDRIIAEKKEVLEKDSKKRTTFGSQLFVSGSFEKCVQIDNLRKFMIEGALLLAKRPVPWVHAYHNYVQNLITPEEYQAVFILMSSRPSAKAFPVSCLF